MMTIASIILPMCFLAVGDTRSSLALEEEVDLIELNHFYDDLGRHVYDQVIFYEWAPDLRDFFVRGWCLVDSREVNNCKPNHTHHDDRWHIRWFDKDNRVVRKIQSPFYRETWSQVDPERANKKLLDEKQRIVLIQVPSKPGTGNTVRR